MNYELRIMGVKGKEPVIQYRFVHCGHFVVPIIIDGDHKGLINRGVHGEGQGCKFRAEE